MEQTKHYYTDEKNAQVVIALLKAHGIRDIVISPGATNDCFVLSVQDDPDFRLYSAVDERHAGYVACGMAQESGKPVVINCTGATSSRNYMSALTEAFYRKLPILALTCSQHSSHIGQMYPQMTDRIHLPADVVKLSVQCPIPHTVEEKLDCELKVNRALLELKHRGGGPVHINLETDFTPSYSTEALPDVRVINRVMPFDSSRSWPKIESGKKVLVWIGSHKPFTNDVTHSLEAFVNSNNAVVIGDITSNCSRAFPSALLCSQNGFSANPIFSDLRPDLIVHIGEISGDYPTFSWLRNAAPVWRVSEDGELRDFLGSLGCVFEMPENCFFEHYAGPVLHDHSYQACWQRAFDGVREVNPEMPFSAQWIAKTLAQMLPDGSNLHLGILNPLRCWNVTGVCVRHGFSTVGGFGIDGGTSSMIGSALASPDVLNFGVFGDLSFFYDLNSLGNRHIGKNIRILLINNGEGGEFTTPGHIIDNAFCGERVHDYIAAKGHNGCQAKCLVRHFVEDLGFEYLSADDKGSFTSSASKFVDLTTERPVVFECFTTTLNDRYALSMAMNMMPYVDRSLTMELKSAVKGVIPIKIQNVVRSVINK